MRADNAGKFLHRSYVFVFKLAPYHVAWFAGPCSSALSEGSERNSYNQAADNWKGAEGGRGDSNERRILEQKINKLRPWINAVSWCGVHSNKELKKQMR